MSSEPVDDLESMLRDFRGQMQGIASIQQERARLMGRATVRGKRVTVVVNADGTVIETKFGPGAEELSYDELAEAVTEAAQRAAADAAAKSNALMMPLHDERARLPKLHDVIPDLPNPIGETPQPPAAAAERRGVTDASW